MGCVRGAVSRRPILLLALLLLSAASLPAQNAGPAEAMALLAKATSAYSTGAAFESPFTQIYTPAGFSTARRESGTVWVQAPERLRFDYAAPDVKVFTYDGGEGRFYSPEDKQLTIHKLSPDERARLPLVFLEKPDALAERYETSRDAAGAVVLKPRAADSELSWLKLSIAASGFVGALSYQDTSGNRTEFRFEAWKSGKARPAADYHVDGAKGTRTVTQ
jgi:chaperone LolA